jgi:hypothetical protein
MAKKSSKASSPSWRTLMRQAKAADEKGQTLKAASLRREASKLRPKRVAKAKPTSRKKTARRSEVMKKAWATRRAKANLVADELSPRAEAQAINAVRDDWENTRQGMTKAMSGDAPGRGEIVGGAEHQFAEEIAKLARKKGGKDAIQNKITQRIVMARAEGESLAEIPMRKRMVEQRQKLDQQIVCGFISEVDDNMRQHGGLPRNQIWTLNALLIVKIVDALKAAGYTGGGMRDEPSSIVRPRS